MPDLQPNPAPVLRSTPSATYRLQFHKEFSFSAARDLAPYLQELGISHVYSSPILTARAGSMHGYDVVSYEAINPELGGEAAFVEMAGALKAHGIGIILDIVPNHVAVGGADNAMWLDLLQNGRDSAYARWFDVDFDGPDAALIGKVHAPFLGEPLHEALANGGLALVKRADGTGYAIAYGEHLFPIRPQDEAAITAAGPAAYADAGALEALLAQQNFVLDWWRNAGDRINWRRFFDITQLAGIRMEEPAAFEAVHAIALRLYGAGLIDGLRIDHIDGLADPAAYCAQLRQRLDALQGTRPPDAAQGRAWLLVEKILAGGEDLVAAWDVDGTTGYDFMDQVSRLQHRSEAAATLAAQWCAVSGRSASFDVEEEAARREVLGNSFDGQRERVVDALLALAAAQPDACSITRQAFRRAVPSLIAKMRVYRSYATGRADGVEAGAPFQTALAQALAEPSADSAALRFIAGVMAGEGPDGARADRSDAIRRFNQLTAPLAAKAVEDMAFYRYGRLISRNDVGFDVGHLAIEPADFHALMQARARNWPRSMLATATHDHKRGEDIRARLAVLSEQPEAWAAAVTQWFSLNDRIRPHGLDRGDEHMLYQMLVGAWPLELAANDAKGLSLLAERVAAWWQKALREAKLRSGWAAPDADYEAMAARFVTQVLTPGSSSCLDSLARFVGTIAQAGAANGLAQLALRCTLPGVPDTYQGTEFWDFSLVDPDNRRPVAYGARRIALAQRLTLDLLAESWRDGRIKQAVLRKLLHLRSSEPALFASGDYEPIAVEGERRDHVVAFMRRAGDRAVAVVVARCCAAGVTEAEKLVPGAAWWGDTRLTLPFSGGEGRGVIGPDVRSETIMLAEALPVLPVAVWSFDLGPTGRA